MKGEKELWLTTRRDDVLLSYKSVSIELFLNIPDLSVLKSYEA